MLLHLFDVFGGAFGLKLGHRVAFGIMMGFAFNLVFTRAQESVTTFCLIQGAPLVPALALLIMVVFVCPESPRYHLLKGPNYSVEKAYAVLRRVRNTEVSIIDIGDTRHNFR
jgi:hypothetical protein